jgi:tight adherence protein C
LQIVNLEIRAGTPREDALRHLGERTGLKDIQGLVAMLIQTDRFGTSIAQALRVHSDDLRVKRRQRAAAVGFVVGLAIMLGTFTRFSYLAGIGFILMVASAATIAMAMRASRADNPASFSVSGWMQDARERWRRER